jgi:hypothetical protein
MNAKRLAEIKATLDATFPIDCYFHRGGCDPDHPRDGAVHTGVTELSDEQGKALETLFDHCHEWLTELVGELARLRECVGLRMDLSNHHNAAKCPYCKGPGDDT